MTTRMMMIFSLLAPLAAGCGDSTPADMAPVTNDMAKAGDMAMATGDMAMATGDMAMATGDMAMAGFPAPPMLGAQIDRMARAGVNTALTCPFEKDKAIQDKCKDDYNQNADPTMWGAKFGLAIRGNLGILDGLDGKCGNQAGANPMVLDAKRYDTLTGALADDELYVNTATGTCKFYLGVELKALGAIMFDDCGGRTPTQDTIDATYSLLAVGAPSGVSDGIDKDGDGAPATLAADTGFPFLGTPN
ncbi:MAG: hypothetical protein EXR72_16865 [Myxococcales bacterium]|nr:hypothetical protein [Myxococcales bacterium]